MASAVFSSWFSEMVPARSFWDGTVDAVAGHTQPFGKSGNAYADCLLKGHDPATHGFANAWADWAA